VAEIAITQAAFAGFGILRRKPWAPLVWSLLYAAILGGLVVYLGGAFFQVVGKLVTLPNGATPSPQLLLGFLGSILGAYFLMLTVFWALGAVINMAVVRAVMEPEASAFAYLRFGRAELWLMLANFILFILYSIVSTAMAIPIALVSVFAVTMAPREFAPFITLPFQLVTWTVTIWLGLRFCMVAPMIFADRKFRLFESWSFTRGRVGRLFLVGLAMVAVAAAIYAVLSAIGLAIGVPMFFQIANSITAEAFLKQTPAQIWNQVQPFVALYIVMLWIGSTVLFPLFFAPWPDVYRQLKGGELAATFS
jgi:hypothetical protein